jgi:hypothetical protein
MTPAIVSETSIKYAPVETLLPESDVGGLCACPAETEAYAVVLEVDA